jgi:hypothetical protein
VHKKPGGSSRGGIVQHPHVSCAHKNFMIVAAIKKSRDRGAGAHLAAGKPILPYFPLNAQCKVALVLVHQTISQY